MTLDSETLAILQKAALQNQPLESTGLHITKEILETYRSLRDDYENAPKGSMAWIVEDLEWGKWDKFERANEKAHGPLFGDKPLDEQVAEKKAEIRRRNSQES